MEFQYIKTDKNGTKWYNDWTCPRCGGAGASDKWLFTGRVCYECGGTGKRRTPKIVKSYTPEYEAKLAAKRAAREEKRTQEYEAGKTERKANGCNRRAMCFGFNDDGKAYVYTGSTYDIKDDLRLHGAHWEAWVQKWISPTPIKEYPCVELNASEVMYWDNRQGDWNLNLTALEEWVKEYCK